MNSVNVIQATNENKFQKVRAGFYGNAVSVQVNSNQLSSLIPKNHDIITKQQHNMDTTGDPRGPRSRLLTVANLP